MLLFQEGRVELLYTQSNLKEILEKENFDHFSFDFYSDTITNDSTGLTERETARRAYKMAKEFVADFDNSFQNLFFYGDTGVGKTFLSHCIAHDLLDSAHCVLYFSSFELFDFLAGSAFSRGSDAPDDEPIFDCDLLSLMTWVQSLPTALYLHSFSCASMSGSCARNLRLFPQT